MQRNIIDRIQSSIDSIEDKHSERYINIYLGTSEWYAFYQALIKRIGVVVPTDEFLDAASTKYHGYDVLRVCKFKHFGVADMGEKDE